MFVLYLAHRYVSYRTYRHFTVVEHRL